MLHLDYRDARPIYCQIADNFRSQICAGVLCEGDKLPSVRELAGELAINPNTIQRAYRELEADGWIASVSGKGSFVCGVSTPSNGNVEQMLNAFDEIVDDLLQSGIPLQTLIQRLKQGGGYND